MKWTFLGKFFIVLPRSRMLQTWYSALIFYKTNVQLQLNIFSQHEFDFGTKEKRSYLATLFVLGPVIPLTIFTTIRIKSAARAFLHKSCLDFTSLTNLHQTRRVSGVQNRELHLNIRQAGRITHHYSEIIHAYIESCVIRMILMSVNIMSFWLWW